MLTGGVLILVTTYREKGSFSYAHRGRTVIRRIALRRSQFLLCTQGAYRLYGFIHFATSVSSVRTGAYYYLRDPVSSVHAGCVPLFLLCS